VNGYMELSDRLGLGIELGHEVVDSYRADR
jgi:hypothetical protein